MDNNTVTILNEEFENDKTGEKVQGITIIVEGKLKEVLDLLMKNNPDYKNYTEIVRDAFSNGFNSYHMDREISAPFTSKYGFSVVAPISTSVPSSTNGNR